MTLRFCAHSWSKHCSQVIKWENRVFSVCPDCAFPTTWPPRKTKMPILNQLSLYQRSSMRNRSKLQAPASYHRALTASISVNTKKRSLEFRNLVWTFKQPRRTSDWEVQEGSRWCFILRHLKEYQGGKRWSDETSPDFSYVCSGWVGEFSQILILALTW